MDIQIKVNDQFSFLQDYIKTLPTLKFQEEGDLVYKARNEVRLIEKEGLKIVVKKFKVPHLVNQVAYSCFRKSKARRSYEYAEILIQKRIPTPQPVAYIEVRKLGLLQDSYYISLECPYTRMMREFWEPDLNGREDIIKAFAKFSVKLHDSGILHVDFSPGNILFDKNEDGIHFSLVDINRMKFVPVNEELGYKNFERLWFGENAFRLLAREYALERGFNPNHAVDRMLYYKNKFMKSRGHNPKTTL